MGKTCTQYVTSEDINKSSQADDLYAHNSVNQVIMQLEDANWYFRQDAP